MSYNASLRRSTHSISRKVLVALSFPVVAVVSMAMAVQTPSLSGTISLNLPESAMIEKLLDARVTDTTQDMPNFEYQIQKGDSLSGIFNQLGLSYKTILDVMESDLNYLALDTLQPGNKLRFWIDESTGVLSKMELKFDLADRVVYERNEAGVYEYKDISVPGLWASSVIMGEINGSFSVSARRAGLSSSEIASVAGLFKSQMNFGRDLRAGDRFEVVRKTQSVDGVETGKTRLEAVKIYNRSRVLSAYMHSDGQFYNENAEGLQSAFQRYPVNNKWRISSHFNPKRKHPVTGKVTPHNGTDFATPVGTPVMAAGDGIVAMIRTHPYAGKYVVIAHGDKYKTRYLHLDKILVSKGQRVSRGQRIGLSGKTGRVTGAHLHYEMIEYGRPVNAMRAKIPLAVALSKKERAEFDKKRNEYDAMFEFEHALSLSLSN